MYLLKLAAMFNIQKYRKFTFHHVSIKTYSTFGYLPTINKFTFHHVSIKTHTHFPNKPEQLYLHSTMYLLKPAVRKNGNQADVFTFHHVSIKTRVEQLESGQEVHLHSTMYLLKP